MYPGEYKAPDEIKDMCPRVALQSFIETLEHFVIKDTTIYRSRFSIVEHTELPAPTKRFYTHSVRTILSSNKHVLLFTVTENADSYDTEIFRVSNGRRRGDADKRDQLQRVACININNAKHHDLRKVYTKILQYCSQCQL